MGSKRNRQPKETVLGEPTPGITEPRFCRDPLGTEGELTPGPDDYNPYDDPPPAGRDLEAGIDRDPTDGRDPFLFDDVAEDLEEADSRRPQLNLGFGGSWL
jgi:hypothetical protein